jgi:hypothetical protein
LAFCVVATSRGAQMADIYRVERMEMAEDQQLLSLAPIVIPNVLKVVSGVQP